MTEKIIPGGADAARPETPPTLREQIISDFREWAVRQRDAANAAYGRCNDKRKKPRLWDQFMLMAGVLAEFDRRVFERYAAAPSPPSGKRERDDWDDARDEATSLGGPMPERPKPAPSRWTREQVEAEADRVYQRVSVVDAPKAEPMLRAYAESLTASPPQPWTREQVMAKARQLNHSGPFGDYEAADMLEAYASFCARTLPDAPPAELLCQKCGEPEGNSHEFGFRDHAFVPPEPGETR